MKTWATREFYGGRPFTHSFNKYLLSAHYVTKTCIALQKTHKNPALMGLTFINCFPGWETWDQEFSNKCLKS